MILAWGKKVDQKFRDKVFEICISLGWNPGTHACWLMSCMAFESAESFRPDIRNAAGSGAVGLIQFMPFTAQGLGTSTKELSKMSAVDQLAYVQRYFRPYAKRITTLSDMYMAILMPKFVGAPEDAVLFLDPKVSYRQNAGLDTNTDGKITKAEAAAKVQAKFDKGMLPRFGIEVRPLIP